MGAQVSNKPYYILVRPGHQVWIILETALWGAWEDVQKADGSLGPLEKSGPSKSNRSGTQPLISQAVDLKSLAQAQQLAHCFETHLQFPKETGRIYSLLWRSSNAEHGKNKILNQRGSNIQSQGTRNQLKHPPLLTVRAALCWKGPEDGQPPLDQSLIKLLTSTTGSKSQDLQVTGKSVSNQAGLWHAAVVGFLCQTQHCRLICSFYKV